MILVDTNTWVHHIRGDRSTRLPDLLRTGRVRTCAVVLGELRLGSGLPPAVDRLLAALPAVPSPSAEETTRFLERQRRSLAGTGIGWADLQVIIAAQRAGALLYSEDGPMRRAWLALGYRLADGGPREP